METMFVALGFFAASFVATVAAIALSFQDTVEWAIACGVIAVIFSLAGLFFTLGDLKHRRKK